MLVSWYRVSQVVRNFLVEKQQLFLHRSQNDLCKLKFLQDCKRTDNLERVRGVRNENNTVENPIAGAS